jgi:hypothetical protein
VDVWTAFLMLGMSAIWIALAVAVRRLVAAREPSK